MVDRLILKMNTMIYEGNDWHDVYWGVCNGVGENMLGKMLMKIRQLNRAFGDTV